jgi:vacuolar-type H+-ATPase subunit E/Vma4
MEGKIKLINTIEARLKLIFDQMLPEIRQKLLGITQNRKHYD